MIHLYPPIFSWGDGIEMPFNYIFIGLPGVGKTTVLKSICKTRADTRLFVMDDEIKKRLNKLVGNPQASDQLKKCATNDIVVNTFCEKWCQEFEQEIVIKALLRTDFEKHSSAIMALLGEQKWREFEAAIAADYLKNEQDCAFDLGGSQPLIPTVQKICKEVGITFVYLKADHETICAHLNQEQADGRPRWQHVSNYQAAGVEGWRLLAQKHQKERESLLEALAELTIDVTNSSIEEVNLKVRAAIAKHELRLQDQDNVKVELDESIPILYGKVDQGENSDKPQQEAQTQLNKHSPTNHFLEKGLKSF